MSAPIRCVAFDAVGTLIYPEPSVSRVYWSVGQEFGSQLSLDDVRQGFTDAFSDMAMGLKGDYSTSEVEERERWRKIVRQVLHDVDDFEPCFRKLHTHFGRPEAWQLFPDVTETLEWLADAGMTLAIASNFDERLLPVCDAMPVLQEISCRVVSAGIGWHKPSPQFYGRLLNAVDCRPEELLMVGDDYVNDYLGAKNCGLQAAWIDRTGGPSQPDAITSLKQLKDIVILS